MSELSIQFPDGSIFFVLSNSCKSKALLFSPK
jgi:hypothetical protein